MNKQFNRRTDPATSQLAARKLANLGREKQRIISAFRRVGDMTDSELEALATKEAWPYAGHTYYRRRRSDLKSERQVRPTSTRRANAQGNSEVVWTLVEADLECKPVENKGEIMNHTAVFRKIDDEWGVQGEGLIPGERVVVTTKSGMEKTVIIKEILEEQNRLQTARFTTDASLGPDLVKDGRVIFHRIDDSTWGIQGIDLVEGDEVTVTTKDGQTKQVIVGQIVSSDETLCTATYTWAEEPADTDQERISFKKYHGDYAIRGKDLEEGCSVTVTKKSGEGAEVIVGAILHDDGTTQIAEFEWAT